MLMMEGEGRRSAYAALGAVKCSFQVGEGEKSVSAQLTMHEGKGNRCVTACPLLISMLSLDVKRGVDSGYKAGISVQPAT